MRPIRIPGGGNARRAILRIALVVIFACVIGIQWFATGEAQDPTNGQLPPSEHSKILIATSLGNVVTSSLEQPNKTTLSQLESLLQRYPGNWRVDLEKGAVSNLTPTTSVPISASPKAFTLSFLSEFSTLLGITAEETAYLMEFDLSNRKVVEYRQVIGGVPVEQSFITFSVIDSNLEQVTSRVYPDVSRIIGAVTPALDKQSAIDFASVDFRTNMKGGDGQQVKSKADLVVLPQGGTYFLTWKIEVTAIGRLDSYTYYVDAITSRVVMKYSNLLSQEKTGLSHQPTGLQQKSETSAELRRNLSLVEKKEIAIHRAEKPEIASSPQLQSLQPQDTWQTILSDNFDTLEFPYGLWSPFDSNSIGGELYWDDQNCVFNDPNWSLWAADGGANRRNACTDNYVNDMDSWVTYGPFDLTGASDGLLEFHYNNVSEQDFDFFKWLVSIDGTHFYGYQVSGNSNGWQYQSIDFKNVPTLGNITGRSQVWIAFVFSSDDSIVSGKGAFVDDVAIKRLLTSSCTGVSGHVGGHIYGKNQNELQLRDFKNIKVVLNKTLASDSYTVTDSVGNYSSSECSDYIRFELEGYGSRNFLKVLDCNNGITIGADELKSANLPFSSQVNYDWNEGDENKKEVNVFWHINEMHDWYANLLGQDLMNYQVLAYVDYVDLLQQSCFVGKIQAYYQPSEKNIYFCPSGVSRESDVIYHEYTHGLVDHITNYNLPGPDERGAMSEGIADYFAAVKNNDPAIGEGLGTIRNITEVVDYNNKCYAEVASCSPGQYKLRSSEPQDSNDFGYIHDNSLVPSGSLWNLRQTPGLSGSYIDKLVLDTLILRKPLTFAELINGLIGQDGGAHESQIRAAFATRGVSSCTYFLDPTSQIFIASASAGSFNVSTASNCSWSATSNVSWLSTSSSGTGNGTVNYSVAANTGNSRTGTISVGGQTFTVFQSAGNGNGCPSTTIVPGQTINTTLTTGCVFTGTSRYIDIYKLNGTVGQQIVFAMSSTAFDTYLFLDGPDNHTIAIDDDGGAGTNSRIPADSGFFTLPATGTYTIYATSFSADGMTGSTGPYTISLLVPAPNTLQFSAATFNVNEGGSSIGITVVRSGDTSSAVSVDYASSDGSATQAKDYTIAAGRLNFAAGDTSKTFTLLIVDDVFVESTESINLSLSNPNGATLGSLNAATATITDNDSSPPTTNPLDDSDARFFVREHYSDFLSRVPDTSGYDYWAGQITQCGVNPTCRLSKSIDVSNAFYFEQEFQQTGSYVYRLYRAAFGNNQPFPNPNPDPAHPGEEKKVPLYTPFMRDRAQVRGGSQLAQLQLDLANAFVLRNEFIARYSLSLNGSAFVDAVLATIRNEVGADLTSQRNALINLFNSGGRGTVLYRLADDNLGTNPINNRTLIDAEYNRSFVFTQYAGYLRRNPDMAGLLFWLNQVNSAPLRDVSKQHAMVCSFITSSEYQQRFSSVVTHSNAQCGP